MYDQSYLRLFMWGCCLSILSSCSTSFSKIYPYELTSKESFFSEPRHLTIDDSKGLRLSSQQGRKITELSGISWDVDEKILYAVSDEGKLYHLSITVQGNKLTDVTVLAEYSLVDNNNKSLKKKWRDAEGLSSRYHNNRRSGDTELIIAFERKPRVVRYTTKGKYLGEVKLPAKLNRKKHYASKNKALESVVVHPAEGVITAAEFPLKGQPRSSQTLYAASGKEWHFTASNAKNSAVTGLEVLPNGNILVLERAWAGIQHPIVITLSELAIHSCQKNDDCISKPLARLSSAEGWMLDNFEGLAHFKDNQYFMISDDNDKEYQSTVLVLFSVNH